ATAPVLWGSVGTNGQHAFHQLLHQGTQLVPTDFIIVHACAERGDTEAHRVLLANALAQSAALMMGHDDTAQPYRHYPGNQRSSSILLPRIDPLSLGVLVALYDHKVYVQGIMWGISCFGQWGVALGKGSAKALIPVLAGEAPAMELDNTTQTLIDRLRAPT